MYSVWKVTVLHCVEMLPSCCIWNTFCMKWRKNKVINEIRIVNMVHSCFTLSSANLQYQGNWHACKMPILRLIWNDLANNPRRQKSKGRAKVSLRAVSRSLLTRVSRDHAPRDLVCYVTALCVNFPTLGTLAKSVCFKWFGEILTSIPLLGTISSKKGW